MTPVDFSTLAQQCAPGVHPTTMQSVVQTESGFNPYAIGVVGGRLAHQPRNRDEAVATARALEKAGWNFSMGLSQVNRSNLTRYGLDTSSVFDPCSNLRAGAAILSDCYTRAAAPQRAVQGALRAAFSCYYSGNFSTGFKPDFAGQPSYVQKVVDAARRVESAEALYTVPAVIPDTGAASASVASQNKAVAIPVVKTSGGKLRKGDGKTPGDNSASEKDEDANSAMVF